MQPKARVHERFNFLRSSYNKLIREVYFRSQTISRIFYTADGDRKKCKTHFVAQTENLKIGQNILKLYLISPPSPPYHP